VSDVKFNCPFKNKPYSGAKKAQAETLTEAAIKQIRTGERLTVRSLWVYEETGNATSTAATTVPGLPDSLHLFAVLWCCGKYRQKYSSSPSLVIMHVCLTNPFHRLNSAANRRDATCHCITPRSIHITTYFWKAACFSSFPHRPT